MKYVIKDNWDPVKAETDLSDGQLTVDIVTTAEYKKQYPAFVQKHFLLKSLSSIQYCKVDMLSDCAVGTFLIPAIRSDQPNEVGFGYYMNPQCLLFIDDSGIVKQWIQKINRMHVLSKTTTAHAFFEFLEFLVDEDVVFLQQYEERLDQMEEDLLQNHMQNFEQKIHRCRKELASIDVYYSQLSDLAETLAANHNEMFTAKECQLFTLFVSRVARLHENVHSLREYSVQLREMYQSKIDIRQNKVMQFLTVVTTIFMPLTLLVGWYGMNFNKMPELSWEMGYPIIILISVAIIIAEILYFKHKKWL